MTKEQTKQAIKVMKAWVDGENIQARAIGEKEWDEYDSGWNPNWNWLGREYRVKPKPMEIQVWVDDGGNIAPIDLMNSPMDYGYKKKTFIEKI